MTLQEIVERLRRLDPRMRVAAGLGGVAVVAVVALGVAAATGAFGSGGSDDEQVSGSTPSATAGATRTATSVPPTQEGVSGGHLTPEPSSGPAPTLTDDDLRMRGPGTTVSGTFRATRLIIPKIGVDAPFTVRTVGPDGVMGNPKGPTDVAWYDFSQNSNARGGIPGVGGNSIISGHVDYVNYGPAVFWNLRQLQPGDEIQIVLDDGTVLKYVVEWNRTADGATANWPEIVRATLQESVTLITCTGTFDPATRSYDRRQIVWAVRVS